MIRIRPESPLGTWQVREAGPEEAWCRPPGTVPVMTPDLVAVTKQELCSVSIEQPCKARSAELQTTMIHMEVKNRELGD